MLQLAESRLDNVVYRMGIASSRPAARQLVSHRHITVNGEKVNIPTRAVHISAFDITRIELPEVDFRVACSKGTYIRSIVDDLGQNLGCGAYVTRLHRTEVADYPTDKMVSLDTLSLIHI